MPLRTARVSSGLVALAGGGVALRIAADAAFLRDRRVRYPVTIDSGAIAVAQDASRSGPPRARAATACTSTCPGAPTNVQGLGYNETLYVTWSPPTSGPAPVSYTITAYRTADNSVVATHTLPAGPTGTDAFTFRDGIVNGQEYYPGVVATSAAGDGPAAYSAGQYASALPWSQFDTLGGANPSEPAVTCRSSWGVDCGTGNFSYSHTDLSVPGRGIPLGLVTTYNSQDPTYRSLPGFSAPMPWHWTTNYSMRLDSPQSGTEIVHQENGSTVYFFDDGHGGWHTEGGAQATLTNNPGGGFTLRRTHALTTFVFDASGRLVSEADRNGYSTTVSYDGSGHLSKVTDPAGRSLSFVTDANGQITSASDQAGRQVSFVWDSQERLTQITDAAGGITTFAYQADGTEGPMEHLAQITSPDANANGGAGNVVSNTFDGATTACQTGTGARTMCYAYSTDPPAPGHWGASQTTITDPDGHQVIANQQAYQLRTLTRGSGSAQQTSSSFDYDMVAMRRSLTTDPRGNLWKATYDASANLLTSTDPLNRTTTYSYDAQNQLKSEKDPLGVSTSYGYDAHSNLTTVSRPLTSTGQTQLTTYGYDPAKPGDLTSVTDPNGKIWGYSYDPNGNLISQSDPLGDKATFGYDAAGRRTSAVSPRGNVTGANAALYTTSYAYDPLGDLTSITDPLNHTSTMAYDGDQNLISSTDANLNKTSYSYDAFDELTKVTRPDLSTLSTVYDVAGNVVEQDDAAGKTLYGYDALNRVTSETDPLNRARTYAYDGSSNLTSLTEPANGITTTTTFGYDTANQRTSIAYSDGTTHGVTYGYDGDSQRTSMTDGSGASSYTYDSLHDLTSDTDGGGHTVGYGYDLANDLTSITYPNGKQVTRTYDPTQRLQTVTDWLGNTTTLGYNADSAQTSTSFPAGTSNVDSYGYDNADQLTSTQMSQGSSILASLSNTRDNNGQLLSDSQTGLPGPASTSYSYTSLNQLASANSAGYGYDTADNITRLDGKDGYGYDSAHELTSSPATADPDQVSREPASYRYDDQLGARTSATRAVGLRSTYSYDQGERLTTSSPATYPISVGGGYGYSTALQSNGTVLAWGYQPNGELGIGNTTTTQTPTEVRNLSGVTQLASTWAHSLALRADGSVWAWGANGSGQLGDRTVSNRLIPVAVTGLQYPVTSVAASRYDSYATDQFGTVWSWGDNSHGQLGNNTTTGVRSTAGKVQGLGRATQVAATYDSAIALKSDGTVWTWGWGAYGQLGTGQTSDSLLPAQVPGLTGVTQIAAGLYTVYALKSDGTVWTWGWGADGELGDGTTSNHLTPEQIPGLSNVKTIIAGTGMHALAIENDGSVWAWGFNASGQLGDGTTTNHLTPEQITGITNPTALGIGYAHTLALTTPTNLKAWGSNTYSQLGNGTSTASTTPTQATLYHATPALPKATYTYDGDGLRTSKSSNGTTLQYAWDQSGGLPLLLTDGSTNYINDDNGLPIEQIDKDGNVTYYHHDQLGSTRLLTNNTGNSVGSASYNPYGALQQSTGTTTPLGYAGQYTDPETGFQYLRNRYYDPATGNFLTRDPLTATTRTPYNYAQDNPTNNTDPTGLMCANTMQGGGSGRATVAPPAKACLASAAEEGDIDSASFAQKTFRETFSDEGRFAGRTINDVAGDLRSGALSPSDVPIEVINRGGNSLILNTRSAQALIRARIPRSEWDVVNETGDSAAEARLSEQLARNKLRDTGCESPTSSGG